MVQVALMDDYQAAAQRLAQWDTLPAGSRVQAFHDVVKDENALAERLKPFDVVMAMRERTLFPASLLRRLPNLKLLCTAGMRNAAIDDKACTELGIVLSGTSAGTQATVEMTWALILALVRHVPEEAAALKAGRWQSTYGAALEKKTLGILGLGTIGTQVARIAQAFQMRVIAWSQNLTAEKAQAAGAELVTKEGLLRQSDILTIQTRLSDRTHNLIAAPELALMKPTAYLINSSRGPIVNERDLAAAVKRKAIAGAAVDVYDEEPPKPGHPLIGLENVLATPHLGYVTEERIRTFYVDTLENIHAWIKGAPLRVLNPDVLSKRRR